MFSFLLSDGFLVELLERVENCKLVGGHGLELVNDLSVVLVDVLTMGDSDVNSEHEKLDLFLSDEVKEVLELGALDLSSELCDDQLELDDELKLVHIGVTHVNVNLEEEREHVADIFQVEFIGIDPGFKLFFEKGLLVFSGLELSSVVMELISLGRHVKGIST